VSIAYVSGFRRVYSGGGGGVRDQGEAGLEHRLPDGGRVGR